MKIKMFLPKLAVLFFIATVVLSCSKDEAKNEEEPTISAEEIARINDAVAQDLVAQFRRADPGIKELPNENVVISSEVEIIDGQYFLVSKSTEFKTTTLLKVVETIQGKKLSLSLADAGVSCTSSTCTSGSGCTPVSSNLSCRDCPGGDCARTITLNFKDESLD